jgi:hypothetical protein
MPTKDGFTAGQLVQKAAQDTTKYDALEVGEALADEVLKNVWECVDKHIPILGVSQFCVVMLMCDDHVLVNAKRRKFYAWPFLPSPRPRQTVFHYDGNTDTISRLWSLPTEKMMAVLSETTGVAKEWEDTKRWVDAFYAPFEGSKTTFHQFIRSQSGVNMMSEKEYCKTLAGNKVSSEAHDQIDTLLPETFDFFKPFEPKVVNSSKAILH